jgi:hypothetical protein
VDRWLKKKSTEPSGRGHAMIKNNAPLKNVSLPSVLVYNFLSRTVRQTDVIA